MKIREEKLKQKVSIPKKLEDVWEPIIDMSVNDFDCHALCDLGASISIMPRKIYDMLGLPPLATCYFDVPLADVAKKKPLGRINDVLIMINNNLVPADFLVMDVECNASCPIILGRPFLTTVGACRWISCRKNTGYHTTDPKIRTQGVVRMRSWIATKHGDGSLEMPENTTHCRERHRALSRFRALVVR
jgi:hypothetical protein